MKKLTLIIGIILILVIVGGGIYLNTLEENPIKKLELNNIFQEEEEQEPQGIVIKEVVRGDNE